MPIAKGVVVADIKQAGPEVQQESEKVVTENRGYWGYREVSEADVAEKGADEGGCGCGCGGK